MKNIQFFRAFVLALFIIALNACGNDPSVGTPEAESAGEKSPALKGSDNMSNETTLPSDATQAGSEVDPGFIAMQAEQYSKILQGKWRETAAPDFTIEINGNKIKYFRSGELVNESTFEIDADCKNNACGEALGWCFIETKDGKTQCNNIRRVDASNLQFKLLGPSAIDKVYTKIVN